jgi:ABC-type glycerol-3-phosphate transport system permease component
MKKSKTHKKITMALLSIVGVLFVYIYDFPIIIVVLNSFKNTAEIASSQSIIPKKIVLDNYRVLFGQSNFMVFMKNSMIVTGFGVLFSVIIAAFSGYAISRWKGPLFDLYGKSLLMLQMFPLILVVIPLFILFKKVGLLNTYSSLIILYTTVNLPFSVWMYKGYFDKIPIFLEEAAIIDGASRMQVLFKIIMPISGPGITAVGIFSFLFSWNEYLLASLFLPLENNMTVPVGLQLFVQQFTAEWGTLMAGATTAMLPTLILFILVQKYFVSGALAGAVKG